MAEMCMFLLAAELLSKQSFKGALRVQTEIHVSFR